MTSAPVSQRARELLLAQLPNNAYWAEYRADLENNTVDIHSDPIHWAIGCALRAIDRALSDRVIGLPSREEIARAADPVWWDWFDKHGDLLIAADRRKHGHRLERAFSVGGEG